MIFRRNRRQPLALICRPVLNNKRAAELNNSPAAQLLALLKQSLFHNSLNHPLAGRNNNRSAGAKTNIQLSAGSFTLI